MSDPKKKAQLILKKVQKARKARRKVKLTGGALITADNRRVEQRFVNDARLVAARRRHKERRNAQSALVLRATV